MDTELDVWREQWQSETAIPLDLRRKVERQSRFMKIALLADILVTVVIGGGITLLAVRRPQPDMILLAGGTWLFLAAAWMFTLTVNRGNWSPSAVDTASFINLSVRRCRGRLAATWFGTGLFVTELTFCLGWIYEHTSEPRTPILKWLLFSSIPIDLVWLTTLLLTILLFWYRRRKRAELTYLLNLRETV